MPDSKSNPILLALDTPDTKSAKALREELEGVVGGFKIGKEFFTGQGPQGVRAALGDAPLFLDLKFHDIPNTVAGALRSAAPLRPMIVNVHASGGPAMMRAAGEAARKAARELGTPPPLVIAVTILTSLDDEDLKAVGYIGPVGELAEHLARLAADCGLDGVVCSPHEITRIKKACGSNFKLVVPGIRPAWAASGDQKRIMTPGEAIEKGADFLVIGRPITGASKPREAAERILDEIDAGRAEKTVQTRP